jgi:phosphatidylinositol alpha-1,6-mannosyltransferase
MARAEDRRMAVLVTNDFPPHYGGIQRFMSRLADELSLRNEPVVVVAPRISGSARFDGLQRYKIVRYLDPSRAIGFAAMTASLLWTRIVTRDPLTIASMWFPGGLAACLIPRPLRGRLGVLAHGAEIAPARGGLRRVLMRYVFARADVIIANSRFTRSLLIKAGIRSAIAVVNPGIDAQPITPQRAAVPTIVSVGRLVARKGFDTVIAALPVVAKAIPDVRYEIVGSGPQRAELERLARDWGVEDRVSFSGAVDDAAVREAYARAWCFALPVRTIDSDVEGFGVVYLEAALAELPVVGGLESGAEDAIAQNETGLLVDGESNAAVAEALVALLGAPARASAMGELGRERALRDFTWARTASGIAELFSKRPS